MTQIKSSNYPDVYEMLGIDTGELGCVMIDTEELVISDVVSEADYYYSEEHTYINGNVSEDVPHLTLLYGLMRSGPELKLHIDRVLEGWQLPEIKIKDVGFFYGETSDFVTLIAHIEVTDQLREGHARLSLLPHINTFDEYKPHITLAYVKSTCDWEQYVKDLNFKFAGAEIVPKAINYGD